MNEISLPLGFLLLLFATFFLVACNRNGKESNADQPPVQEQVEEGHQPDFPWDSRTALVVYAGHSGNDDPDEDFPSLVFLDYDAKLNFMAIDGAPYLTVLSKEHMREQLNREVQRTVNKGDLLLLAKIERWVKAREVEGFSYFFLELEPPELAGKAYPIAQRAEQALP